ncbi:hypothetical protein D3C84_691760 [compost metagenome]
MGITQPFNGKQHPGRTSTHRADPIRQRIDHFKNLVACFNPLTGLTQERHHTGVRREQQFSAFEWQAFARVLRRFGPFTADQALLGEERQNAFGISRSFSATGVGLTTQFNGSRQAGQRNLRLREQTRQAQPRQRTGFVERTAAGIFRQQTDPHIQVRSQRTPLRPVLRQGVHVQRRFGVAMQVQHHIGGAGVAEQNALHALQLAARLWQSGQMIDHRLTDQANVGVRIVTEAFCQGSRHRCAQLDEIAVEVLAAARLETPLMIALKQLTQTQWISHRHQFDHTVEQALGFEFGQTLFQLERRAHARQFIGVEAGLDISLALAATETEHRNLAFAAQVAPRQSMIDAFHISASAGPGSPASGARPS